MKGKSIITATVLIAVAACAGPREARPDPIPPRRFVAPPQIHVQRAPAADAPTEDAKTEEFLRREIERRRFVKSPQPPRFDPDQEQPAPEPVPDQRYAEYYRAYGYAYPYARSTFPLHTLAGAGIGAIIGNQSGNEAEGAWIGAGIGLLVDVFH